MSTQADAGSTFSIAAVQQPFRLLELPPELLELLTSSNPPKLHFKSPETKSSVNAPEAVLCSPDRTYIIRQQQTSNGVHVIAATSHQHENEIPETGLASISHCTSSLELMSAPAGSAQFTLKDQLPVFMELEDVEKPLLKYQDKDSIFRNTPMSDAECQQAWTDLVAFELPSSRDLPTRCFRPHVTVLLNTWRRLLQISHEEGMSIASTLRISTMLKPANDLDDEKDWPFELRAAILIRLVSDRVAMSVKEHADTALQNGSTLDRAVTVQWVGLLILQVQHETSPASPRLRKDEFTEQWQNSLPEEWRGDARIDVLPKNTYVTAGEYIRSAEDGAEAGAAATSTVAPAKAVTGTKRKWHEKFAATRKQGKPS